MSALDQAFIKAYGQDAASPGAAQPAQRAAVAARRPARLHARSGAPAVAANQIDNLYADGALYRLEVPQSAEVPPPHYLPPASQHRTVQRRVPGRHRVVAETPAAPSQAEPPAAVPPSARRPARGLAEIARRLSHDLPLPPTAELPPEVLVVEDPEPESAPPQQAPDQSAASKRSPGAFSAEDLPLTELATAADHVPTLVEVCTPWETINDAVSSAMVIVSDEPALGSLSFLPQIDVALDPILEAGNRPSQSGGATPVTPPTPPAVAPSGSPAAHEAAPKKIHRIDPPRQAIEAPHFAAGRIRSTPPAAAAAPPAEPGDIETPPLAELTPEETASLLGEPDEALQASSVSTLPETAEADAAAVETLVPMWEVDRFQWPALCDRLLKDEQSYFAQAGGKLLAAAKDGLKTLGITGSRRGEGRTSLALCLARCAAQSGLNVALIDADFTRPQLAAIIGLEVAYGWQDAAQGKIPLPEAAVRSLADKITVLPLEASSVSWPLSLADKRVSALIRAVAQAHDLVIVDMGPLSGGSEPIFAADEAPPLDAVIVLRDLRYATPSETHAIGLRLHDAGIEAIGIAENFVAVEKERV